MKLFYRVTVLLMISAFFTNLSFAQSSASVNWSCAIPDSQNVSFMSGNLIGLPQIGSPGFVVRDYVNGPGPDQRWWPHDGTSAVSWGNETAQVDSRWVQFAVKPNSNFNFSANEIAIYIGAKGTGSVKANLYYAKDTSFADRVLINPEELALLKDTDSLYILSIDEEVNDGEIFYVRIYPWYTGSPSTSKYLYMRNATLSGSTSEVTYPGSAMWELTDPNSGGTGTTASVAGNVEAKDEFLNDMELNQYTGVNNSQRIRIAGNAWPANQTEQLDTVFVQFEVLPKAGFKFNVTSVSFGIAAASIDKMKANVYYSSEPDFQNAVMVEYSTGDSLNNYLPLDSLLNVSAEPNLLINSGESFYLRIYPWVDNDPSIRTGKYVTLQKVVIGGEIEGTPMPSKVVWPFVDNESPVTTGALVGENQTYSDAMAFYGFTDLPRSNGGDSHCGSIQTVSKEWNAEPNPTDSLWFQYAVSPKFGGTFFAEKFSMFIGGWFTQNIKTEIYISKDITFAEKTLLIADTALVGNSVMPIEATLSETVNTGETLYIRVYPHNTEAEGWAKLVAVDSVIISGTTTGVTADVPTVLTADITDLSTTFATSGGNIPSDGGALVTARGVCWNTIGSPTRDDSKSIDGEGSGSFVSSITGLSAGETYYLRSYATNDAGTGYGEEILFTTLDSTDVPIVFTSSVSNIMVETAEAGGTVTDWGGDTVTVRGVCWSTSANPTISNFISEDGNGLGGFKSLLYPLAENTTYYVRAYATNSKGTGYGQELSFTTQTPSPDVIVVVASDGSGDYTKVQDAFDSVPDFYTGTNKILVKNGTYYEKLFLDRNKVNVVLEGEDRDSTILTYDDYAGIAGGTSKSYSVAIDPDDFIALNITFQNTVKNDGSASDKQGVALRVNGDRQAYYNCNLLGYQDTYYTWGGRGTGRVYMKNCFIEGTVDFIFGRDIVLFDSCTINIKRDKGTLTAASTMADSKFGYVFKDCKLTTDGVGFDGSPIEKFYLGRPWSDSPQTVFINCDEPETLDPVGWLNWNVTPGLYAEYNCFGLGSDYANRKPISRQLTSDEASEYTKENIFAKSSHPDYAYDWMPAENIITAVEKDESIGQIPDNFSIDQNYPNPFNPTTNIRYGLPKQANVKLNVYNTIGQMVVTLVDQNQNAGYHEVNFNASHFASGVYYFKIEAANFMQTKKMILLK
jgi:pectin methylesterase-like acyl-CoA thioesterase